MSGAFGETRENTPSRGFRSNAGRGKIRFFNPLEAWNVRRGELSRLAPAVSQLPVDWYFDESIHELEKKLIFDAGPGLCRSPVDGAGSG
jgi:hypothetical protein